MRGLGLGLVLWALGATVAQAAVLRIDVTGSATGTVRGNLVNSLSIDWEMPIATAASLTPSRPPTFVSMERALQFVTATTGSFLFDGTTATDCSGLLIPVCWRSPNRFQFSQSDGTFSYIGSDFSGGVIASSSGLTYADDELRGFIVDGTTFQGLTLIQLRATFTSSTVSVVPLPASAPLILAGIGALALLGRRARSGAGAA